ncbi:MAG TPA: SDR family oxidoreductase [Acidimicrobiales bacterium]|nr:SDR family oxidoreductase [Acidimicrobiales bacterium]
MTDALHRLFSLDGKTALVTGGGQGIGRMIAQGLIEAGATVYIASRKLDQCEQTARELSEFGECHAFGADLSTEDGCRALVAAYLDQQPSLSILVNNSGANWGAPFAEYPDAAWDRVMNLNVRGAFTLTKLLTPALSAAGSRDDPSRVINIGSIHGLHVPEQSLEVYAYAASKAAIHHLTPVLAKRLGPLHITVNALAPGPFESRMMKQTLERMGDQLASMSPLSRIGRGDDIAGAAIFLASRAGSYVTGSVIAIDGGIATTL